MALSAGQKPPTRGPSNPWPARAGLNVTRGGGLNEGQLRAGPELLFNTKVGAARPQVGRSRLIINLLCQGYPRAKPVSMPRGPVRPSWAWAKYLPYWSLGVAPTWGQLCKNVYLGTPLIQA